MTIKTTWPYNSGGKITGGNTTGDGGGVYLAGGTFIMDEEKIEITGNTATRGGGVYLADGSLTMTGGAITKNAATSAGGGVFAAGGSELKLSGTPTITENTVGEEASNVYLSNNKSITVNGKITGGSIGITTETAPSNDPVKVVQPESGYTLAMPIIS